MELKVSLIGCRTCASVSALSFDAQPAQLERLVRRICLPLSCFSDMGIMILQFWCRGKPQHVGWIVGFNPAIVVSTARAGLPRVIAYGDSRYLSTLWQAQAECTAIDH